MKPALALLGLSGVLLDRLLRSSHAVRDLARWEALNRIAEMAEREAATGAPGVMVAVYVRVAVMHSIAAHRGPWQKCDECHASLPAVRMPRRERP